MLPSKESCGKLPRVKKVRCLHSFFTELIFFVFSSTLLQCSKKKAVLVWSKLVVVFMSKGEAVPAVQIIATLGGCHSLQEGNGDGVKTLVSLFDG